MAFQMRLQSSRVGSLTAFIATVSVTLFTSLDWTKSSDIANRPMNTGTKESPSQSS